MKKYLDIVKNIIILFIRIEIISFGLHLMNVAFTLVFYGGIILIILAGYFAISYFLPILKKIFGDTK
jgi:hypothetical protein